MKGNYSKIAKIERIQNKRWYKQVLLNLSSIVGTEIILIV
jgi:hypothetical protein